MPPLPDPLSQSKFALNALEFVGLVGGTEIISAMGLIPLYRGSRWLRWYNSPGSFDVARYLFQLAASRRSYQAFSRTPTPEVLFGFDGEIGPEYVPALRVSTTRMETGHLGYLVMEKCRAITQVYDIAGRKTIPAEVALVELESNLVDYDYDIPHFPFTNSLQALLPISTSFTCCTMCALVGDYYMASVIAIGILSTGLVSTAIGAGKLSLRSVTKPAAGAPPGHGILIPRSVRQDLVVVVKGSEPAVTAITRGYFQLSLGTTSSLGYGFLTFCSLLFLVECLAQLILIPQGTLFGQVMFIISLIVSWTYSYYLSSFKKEQLQADLLWRKLGNPKLRKFCAGTRTAMVTLVAVLLFNGVNTPPPDAIEKILHRFIPNETHAWDLWRQKVTRQICDPFSSHLQMDEDKGLADYERKLLDVLLRDSKAVFDWFSTEYTNT